MRLAQSNCFTTVTVGTEAERRWLREFLTYTEKIYNPSTGRAQERSVSLLNIIFDSFPTGLLPVVRKTAGASGVAVEVDDLRAPPCEPDPGADLSWLRTHPAVEGEVTHQIAAVEAVVRRRRGLIWSPTGSGKTVIMVGIATALPCHWLVLVHRIDLLQQTADRYAQFTGLQAGVVGDGRFSVAQDCRFVVCSFDTARAGIQRGRGDVTRLLEEWAEGLIVDEAHCLGAAARYNTVMRAERAYYRFGVSATPLARGDGKNLLIVGALGPVIYRVRPDELIDLGLLAKPKIKMIEHRHRPSAATTWRGAYDTGVVRDKTRNALVLDMVRRAEKPALVFVKLLKHGRDLTKTLNGAGVKAQFAWGAKSTGQRRDLLVQLERGYFEVLICNVIFQEGIDVPSLRSVVIAAGGLSTIAALQRIGRGMRADAKTGKRAFEVWDVLDAGCGCERREKERTSWELGIDDDLPGTTHMGCRVLQKHARARAAAYRKEGFEVVIEREGQLELAKGAT